MLLALEPFPVEYSIENKCLGPRYNFFSETVEFLFMGGDI